MSDKATSIIEINGLKMEVDHRTAAVTRIDTLKIGMRVKMLKKAYNGYNVHPAVVVGFDNFQKQPTIRLLYLNNDYGTSGVQFQNINAATEDVELILDADDLFSSFTREAIETKLQNEITKAETALDEKRQQYAFFQKHFGQAMKTEVGAVE